MAVRPLTAFNALRFAEIASGYVSSQSYVVHKEEAVARTTFTVVLEDLDSPYVKRWNEDPADSVKYHTIVAEQGLSLGAYEDDILIGVAVAERRDWNRSLWVWEFHVHEAYRGRGVGRRMMDTLADTARRAGLHALFCETQNTNVGAIRFYRSVGFELDGVDRSFYPPEIDEVAIFMKRRV